MTLLLLLLLLWMFFLHKPKAEGFAVKFVFTQDTKEKTGMAERTIAARLRVGELISEDKKDFIKDNNVSATVLNSIVVGKDKKDVKKASEIHLETIENMETDKNKNTKRNEEYL